MTNTLNKIMHDGDEYLFPTNSASDFDIKDLSDSTNLRTTWSNKQDALVSGTNIKTINGTSVLGNGDIVTPNTTYSAGTGLSLTGTTFANTGVTSVNGSTGAVTVAETESKVFEMPSVGDDISDIISWLTAGKVAILFDGDMSTPGDYEGKYYQVGDWDESNESIYAYQSVPGEATVTGKVIYYSSGIVTDVVTDTKLLAPSGGTQGQVLTQSSTGIPSWQNASGGDVVVSSDADNVLTTGAGLWAGDEADLPASPDSNTLYFTY